MKQINLLFAILPIIFLSSCENTINDENSSSHTSIDTSFISDNLHKHFYEIESIWVYESESGVKDTVKLLRIERSYNGPIYVHSRLERGYVETYKLSYLSSIKGIYCDQYIGRIISRNGNNWGCDGDYIYISSYKAKDTVGFTSIDTVLETMSVSGKLYNNVVKMKIGSFSFESYENWYYYFADSIGVIRKEKVRDGYNEKFWNLIYRN